MKALREKPRFAATMLGMVPYESMDTTAEVVYEHFPEAIRLPLVTRSFEWISEGMPCLEADWERSAFLMVPPEEREQEVIEFYEKYEQEDLDYFATTPKTASFYYEMLERIKKIRPPELKWIGFQMPGPIVLGDTIKQRNGNPAIHHETLRDILIKTVNMKSRWMEKRVPRRCHPRDQRGVLGRCFRGGGTLLREHSRAVPPAKRNPVESAFLSSGTATELPRRRAATSKDRCLSPNLKACCIVATDLSDVGKSPFRQSRRGFAQSGKGK